MKPGPSDLVTQITRRQWLLRLGETVALAGVSGLIPEYPLGFFSNEPPSLPPGLYDPSPDHLVHALSGHHLPVPAAESETDYVQAGAGSDAISFAGARGWIGLAALLLLARFVLLRRRSSQ